MKDSFGREIDYLRISVTQRCNFHCAYCGAAPGDAFELTPEQLAVFARAFARTGIRKIRLTGGEPLIRADIVRIAGLIREAAAPDTLAVTTNGFLLAEKAAALKAAGVTAVNISLDTVDGDCFRRMTGRDALAAVLRGLETALDTGFERVRINTVLLRDVNDGGAEKLISLARDHRLDVRFIELMPFGEQTKPDLLVSQAELLARFPALRPLPETDGAAAYYSAEGFRGRIGFISPVSHKFCRNCRRIRLLSDGRVKPCLGREETYDLLPYLADEARLEAEIRAVILKKPAGHRFENDGARQPAMNTIGG